MLSNSTQLTSTKMLYLVLFSKYFRNYIFSISSYLTRYVIAFIFFRYISHLCYYSNNTEVVSGCLEALDAIMCYSNLKSDSLQTFIIALCRSVNVETYCQTSWKVQIIHNLSYIYREWEYLKRKNNIVSANCTVL